MDELMDALSQAHFTNDFWIVLMPAMLMTLDVLTGFINAWSKNTVKSSVMRQGLARKFGELVIIGIGQLFFFGLNIPRYCVGFISFYIILMELISICENLDKLGVPIPKFIKNALHDASDKVNKGETTNTKRRKTKS